MVRPRGAEEMNDSVHCLMIFYVIIDVLSDNYLYLCTQEPKHVRIMTAIELNAELYRAMGEIADDKSLLERVLAFVKSLKPAKKVEAEREAASTESFVGSWAAMDDEMLNAALAEFSGDFGGSRDARNVARELRQGSEMVRDVKTW